MVVLTGSQNLPHFLLTLEERLMERFGIVQAQWPIDSRAPVDMHLFTHFGTKDVADIEEGALYQVHQHVILGCVPESAPSTEERKSGEKRTCRYFNAAVRQ
jgi:hypothetical protein